MENLEKVPLEIIHNTLDALRYIKDVFNRYELNNESYKDSSSDLIKSLINELNNRYNDLPF